MFPSVFFFELLFTNHLLEIYNVDTINRDPLFSQPLKEIIGAF